MQWCPICNRSLITPGKMYHECPKKTLARYDAEERRYSQIDETELDARDEPDLDERLETGFAILHSIL